MSLLKKSTFSFALLASAFASAQGKGLRGLAQDSPRETARNVFAITWFTLCGIAILISICSTCCKYREKKYVEPMRKDHGPTLTAYPIVGVFPVEVPPTTSLASLHPIPVPEHVMNGLEWEVDDGR